MTPKDKPKKDHIYYTYYGNKKGGTVGFNNNIEGQPMAIEVLSHGRRWTTNGDRYPVTRNVADIFETKEEAERNFGKSIH